jgi:hypothetical protein
MIWARKKGRICRDLLYIIPTHGPFPRFDTKDAPISYLCMRNIFALCRVVFDMHASQRFLHVCREEKEGVKKIEEEKTEQGGIE